MNFRNWFSLKGRDSFTIDPKINPDDARFYFGRDEIKSKLKAQIRRAFVDPGVPKMVIYGSFGSGKTQTLYNLQHYLQNDPPKSLKFKARTVDVVLEMQSKSDHLDWHLQLMEALGKDTVAKWVDVLFGKVPNLDQHLEGFLNDYNLIQAVKNLRGGGEMPLLAWRWLSGHKLSPTDLQRLQLTRNLGDVGAGDMVNVLVGLGRLAEQNEEKLIFLMDEAEEFNNIRDADALDSVHSYLRKFAEPWNSSVGFIMSAYSLTIDDMPSMMIRQDVRTRIGAINYVEIPPLPTVEDVRAFLSQLLAEFIDQKAAEKKIQKEGLGVPLETYPLSAEAFEMVCEYASQDPTKSLPRNIIKTLNECAIAAWDEEKPIVDANTVNEIAPLVFG
jgi:DNA polymerase III delta prime subunit